MEALQVKFNEAKKLMQINVIPRLVGRDGIDDADELVKRLEMAIEEARGAKASKAVQKTVVVIDGRSVLEGALGDPAVARSILDTLSRYKDEEDLIDNVLIVHPDAQVKIMYSLLWTLPDIGSFKDKIKLIS
jgi:hypothetical protein